MAVGKKTHILYDKVIENMIYLANFENPIEPGHFGLKKKCPIFLLELHRLSLGFPASFCIRAIG